MSPSTLSVAVVVGAVHVATSAGRISRLSTFEIVGAVLSTLALEKDGPIELILRARNPVITALAILEVPKMNDVERDCMLVISSH